ncbi:MAG: hypothetical protein ABFR95_08805 [Actinomycetota bacterium]
MRIRILVAVVVALAALTSCGITDGEVVLPTAPGGDTTTIAPDTTSAPDTTLAPTTTEADTAPVDPDETETPWWLLIIVGFALLVFLLSYVRRGSTKKVQIASPTSTWKDAARNGYTDARWLYDTMSEDLAIWRGNAKFDDSAEVGATAGTALAAAWQDMDQRLSRASDNLYSLEASAPDQRTSRAANEVVKSMRSVRAAVDARAEARLNYRTVEAQPETTQVLLQDAREREVRASRNLAETRSGYGRALTHLSTLM